MRRARHLALIAIDVPIGGALLTGRFGGRDDGGGILAVIAGKSSIDAAPENGQEIASCVTGRR